MAQQFKLFSFEKFVTSIFILRSQFPFPKLVSSLIIFLTNTQNLSNLIQSEFGSHNNTAIYSFVILVLRPIGVLTHFFDVDNEYFFLFGIMLHLLGNTCLMIFYLLSARKQNYEQFINKAINYIPLKIICYGLNFYIQLAENILFNQTIYLSFYSLGNQLSSKQDISYQLVILNILAILLYFMISLIYMHLNESQISNQIFGIEKVEITFLSYCFMTIVILISISSQFLEENQRKLILSILSILQQLILIGDILFNQIYIMLYQRLALNLSISINISFIFALLIISSADGRSFFEFFVIIFFPIFLILQCQYNFKEKQIVLNLFRGGENLQLLKFGLMKILNQDTNYQKQDLIYKVLIGQQHYLLCQNQKCVYCNHENIQNPENMCCITIEMYQQFIDAKLQMFLFKKESKKQHLSYTQLLSYSFFLYDFGWIVKSTKILDFLYYQNHSKKSHDKQQLREEILQSPTHKYQLITSNNLELDNFYKLRISKFDLSKIAFLIQEGKQKMKYNLFGSSLQANQQSLIQEFVDEHLHYEFKIKEYEKLLESLLDQKLRLFINLKNYNLFENKKNNFSRQILQFFSQLYKIKKQFLKSQTAKLNNKIQQLQCFFWGEIMQDYVIASSLKKPQIGLEKELKKLKEISHSNILTQNCSYIILEICDNLQTFNILTHSQNFYELYSSKKQGLRTFFDLIPSFIGENHNQLVKQFFETGQNKFYYNFSLNYIMNPENLLSYVQIFHSQTNLFNNHNLTFAVYIQDAIVQAALIVVDQISQLCIFTKNLLSLIGWTDSEIQYVCQLEKFKLLTILSIYPEFDKIVNNNSKKSIQLNLVTIFLPTLEMSQEEIQLLGTNKSAGIENKKLFYHQYTCDIFIERKIIEHYQYFVLTLSNLNKQIQNKQLVSIVPKCSRNSKITSTLNIQQSEECHFDQIKDSPNIGILNSLNFKLVKQQQSIQQKFQTPIIYEFDSTQIMQKVNLLNSNREETLIQSDQLMISQRNSYLLNNANSKNNILLDSQNIQHTEIQERKKAQGQNRKSTKEEINGNNSDFENVLKQREDLLKFINSIKPRRYLLEFQIVQFLLIFSVLIYITLQYFYISQDIVTIMNCFEMTTIYSSIMAPHDLFFSMKATISSYQQMNREGFISKENMDELVEPFYENIGLGFEEIKNSLFAELTEKQLQHFFNDVYLELNFMNENDQNIIAQNLTFRDALYVILQYQYQYEKKLSKRESVNGSPFQVSIYSNYFLLHQQCQQLSYDIFKYQQNLYQEFIKKWIAFQLICNLIFLMTFILLFYKMLTYFKNINRFITPFFYISEHIIHYEIQRQNQLLKDIQSDINCISFYNSEKRLAELKHAQYQKISKQNSPQSKKIQNAYIKFINICILVILLIIILGCSLYSTILSDNFFGKIQKTANLNLLLQEMKLRPGNLFLYREIHFRWQNFTYLTQENKDYLYYLVNQGYKAIDNYLIFYENENFDNYLVDENFTQFYEEVNSQNFCDKIDSTFYNFSHKYCNLAFEGSIQKSMISTLNYIETSMKSQQQLNNFSKRVEFQLYEQEGSQIVSRLFFVLMNEFKKSLQIKFFEYKTFFDILSICYIFLILLIISLVGKFHYKFQKQTFQTAKLTINIIPIQVFFNNQFFQRKMTELKYNLL